MIIGRLLHYTKNSLSLSCTDQHKHKQKDIKQRRLSSFQTISLLTLLYVKVPLQLLYIGFDMIVYVRNFVTPAKLAF